MSEKPHGHFTVVWYGEVCLICTIGAFNNAATKATHMALIKSWEQAGSPQHWVLIVDMRPWEGGTPDSFTTARSMAEWTFSHGLAASIRLHNSAFLPRIVDRLGVLENAPVPILDFSTPAEILGWLAARNFTCEGLGVALTPADKAPARSR